MNVVIWKCSGAVDPSDTINRGIQENGTPSGCIVGRYHLYFFFVPEERVVQKIG